MTLYKYATPARIDVLEHFEIRFTQPGALNDPFELRPRVQALITEAQILEGLSESPPDWKQQLRQAYDMLPDVQRAMLPFDATETLFDAYFASDAGRATLSAMARSALQSLNLGGSRLLQQMYHGLSTSVGILSLSEIPDDLLMWAHYADSHRGMVLGFDETHQYFNRRRSENDEFYFLRKVQYADIPSASSLMTLDAEAVFNTKGSQWSYEREWRMLAPLSDATRSLNVAGDTVYLYSLPPEAVKTIIIGSNATEALLAALKSALAGPRLTHVRMIRARLDLDKGRVII